MCEADRCWSGFGRMVLLWAKRLRTSPILPLAEGYDSQFSLYEGGWRLKKLFRFRPERDSVFKSGQSVGEPPVPGRTLAFPTEEPQPFPYPQSVQSIRTGGSR